MPATPSYYDSIGLLAICDAVDAVDGIPFQAPEKPKPLPEFHTSAKVIPAFVPTPNVGKHAPPQHPYLAHVPVTGVLSPVGSIPYDEQQRVTINQLATTGQLPQQPPPHTIGGVRPNIPVAHNLHGGSSGQRSTAGSHPQSPALTRGMSPALAGGPGGMAKPAGPRGFGNMPRPPQVAGGPGGMSLSGPPGAVRGMSPGIPGGPIPGAPSQAQLPLATAASHSLASLPPSVTSVTATSSRASTPGPSSPLQSPPPPPVTGEQRIEVCQICGRDFKGPKAATHKQQHIRRLHPTEYTPKRGGKRSRLD